jgi:hypothetical protein
VGQTIQVIRQGYSTTDAYGNPTSTETTSNIDNVLVGYGATSEPNDVNRDPIDAHLTLYMPAGTDVQDGDAYLINGEHWVKDGIGQHWQSVQGTAVGVVVYVRRRDG